MRITLNLASRPFVELRPLYLKLRLALAALVVVAIALGVWLHAASVKARAAQARLDALTAQKQKLDREWQGYQASMQEPGNAAVLDRAQFLNGLFARKAFSWTAVMMDLERVLPGGVQVVSIEPLISADGHVTIRLRVTGDREKAVSLVRNLEGARHFVSPRLAGEAAETQSPNGNPNFRQIANASTDVNFDILADYDPAFVKTAKAAETGEGEKPIKNVPDDGAGKIVAKKPVSKGAKAKGMTGKSAAAGKRAAQ